MPHNGELSSKLSQVSILKEDSYIDFFINCEKTHTRREGLEDIKKSFVPYSHFIDDDFEAGDEVENVMGLDSSYVENSLYEQTGQISPFSSHQMLIISMGESVTNLKNLKKLEERRLKGENIEPYLLREITILNNFNFWFNGSNLTPQNTKEEWRGQKNGFKVATRDALRKPEAIITNQNNDYQNPNKEVKSEKDMRLIDVYYYLFSVLQKEGLLRTGAFDFKYFNENDNPLGGELVARSCPNKYSCKGCDCLDPNCNCNAQHKEYSEQLQKELRLSSKDSLYKDIVCPYCKNIICELDAIRLTDQFQDDMSNLPLLNEMSMFLEHLRVMQRLICLKREECKKWAMVVDGPLALYKQSQSVIPGFRLIVGDAVNNGATVFGIVKTGICKEFFASIDTIDNPIKNGTFWIIDNKSRYKYIQPKNVTSRHTHGFETHYGIDVLVKTSMGLQFVVSMAPPKMLSKELYKVSPNNADEIFKDINEEPDKYPEILKMLHTLEQIQMLLYGGSTIPQTTTHGQASISWSVSAPLLARAVSRAFEEETVKNNNKPPNHNDKT